MKSKFELIKSDNFDFSEIIIKNNRSGSRIAIIPELGARLNEAVLEKNKHSFSVLKKISSRNFITRDETFNNAKLFPFANRVKNGSYSFNGNNYQMPVNYEEENNSCHGFVYNKEFKITEYIPGDQKAYITLKYDYDGSLSGYPFDYELFVTYQLDSENGVSCKTKIVNTSGRKLLFSDGWHPFFSLEESINELCIKMDINSAIITGKHGIPTGDIKEIKPNGVHEINGRFFDNIYKVNSNTITVTELYSPGKNISLSIWQEAEENKYRYINIYTPSDRKSIAIEPMTSNINAFNNKQNVIELEPRESWEASFGFYIK